MGGTFALLLLVAQFDSDAATDTASAAAAVAAVRVARAAVVVVRIAVAVAVAVLWTACGNNSNCSHCSNSCYSLCSFAGSVANANTLAV